MKYSIIIEPHRKDEITVIAPARTEVIEKIEALLAEEEPHRPELLGYTENGIVPLEPREIVCFTVEDGKVYARTVAKCFLVKQRLYQLEEQFGNDFIKINQSCLVRQDKIERFHSSIGGSLMVIMKGGYRDYISRRQLKFVKERMGF